MEFIADRDALLKTLNRVIGAVDKRSTLPTLTHVLVTATSNNTITICATDLEVSAVGETAQGVTVAPGSCCIQSGKFKDAISSLDSGDVKVLLLGGGDKITIESGVYKYSLAVLPAEEFPQVNQAQPHFCDFAPDVLPSLIKSVLHAASSNNVSNYNLCGVHIEGDLKTEKLIAVATDGHRLSISSIHYADVREFGGMLTLPNKACALVAAVVSSIALHRGSNMVDFVFPSGSVSSRLLDGTFPAWRRVVPTKHAHYVVVQRSALISAVEAAGVVDDSSMKSVKLAASGFVLNISALGQMGVCDVTIPCQVDGDTTFERRVNGRYLIDSLRSLDGDEVFIKWGADNEPLLITPVDLGRFSERTEVIMPMRL